MNRFLNILLQRRINPRSCTSIVECLADVSRVKFLRYRSNISDYTPLRIPLRTKTFIFFIFHVSSSRSRERENDFLRPVTRHVSRFDEHARKVRSRRAITRAEDLSDLIQPVQPVQICHGTFSSFPPLFFTRALLATDTTTILLEASASAQ